MGGESLVYRVLKAKCLPTTDFVHALIGHNPSYTWRSLISAQSLVIEGMQWRVGNGENIKIWQDKWLPGVSSHKILSPRMFLSVDMNVADLIDSETARWKTEVLDNLFIPHEADLTKSIPLSVILPTDKLVWAETSTRNFTIRSAYKLVVNLFTPATYGTTSDGSLLRKFWEKIWSLPIPHKVRHFCWRACRDTLPTKVKLRRRNVIAEDMCVCCHKEARTNGHIFWGCPKAQETWAASKLQLLHLDVHLGSFMDLFWLVMMTNESATSDPVQHIPDAQQQPLLSAWLPPSAGLFKINVDGALFSSKKQVGIGVVIRDVEGRLKAALCRKIKAPLGSLEVEAKAYKAGLLLARHLGLRDVVLEGDSLIISNALKRLTLSPSSVDAIMKGIHELGAEIGVVHFSHVRNIDNKPAHILARQAQNLVNDVIWIEEIPCYIQQALIQDVSVL
ncbi:uncharacterized protein LOC115951551 [Quercus lobata]|uniref:uncharacterized protein LOC115951551 n=1 Tax=Quercus lobata TaxID=97700 RepID=UPI001244D4DA|nr:uncharacterized protein LOC115951551 [Quercus lobata]